MDYERVLKETVKIVSKTNSHDALNVLKFLKPEEYSGKTKSNLIDICNKIIENKNPLLILFVNLVFSSFTLETSKFLNQYTLILKKQILQLMKNSKFDNEIRDFYVNSLSNIFKETSSVVTDDVIWYSEDFKEDKCLIDQMVIQNKMKLLEYIKNLSKTRTVTPTLYGYDIFTEIGTILIECEQARIKERQNQKEKIIEYLTFINSNQDFTHSELSRISKLFNKIYEERSLSEYEYSRFETSW